MEESMNTEEEPKVITLVPKTEKKKNMVIRNYAMATETRGTKVVDIKVGLSADVIHDMMKDAVGDWPKRIDASLFVLVDGRPRFLKTPSDLFGWLAGEGAVVDWGEKISATLNKGEFLAYLTGAADVYETVSELPHFPPKAGCFYFGPTLPEDDGSFDRLLGFFNPATDLDKALLKAAFMTLFWGGPGGARPAFVICGVDDDSDEHAGRGSGKTTLTDMMGKLTGGMVEFSITTDGETIKKRLLTSHGERLVRFDNVKTAKYSSGDVEGLITAPYISGHRLWQGSGRVPNGFTYVFTFNDAMFSKDMAQRAVMIKLARPVYDGIWQRAVEVFIEQNSLAIYAGIKAVFAQEAKTPTEHLRFGLWTGEVLMRAGDPGMVKLIKAQQLAVDDDQDKSEEIQAAIEYHLSKYRVEYGLSVQHGDAASVAMIVKRSLVHRWVAEALNLPKANSRSLKKMIQRSHLPRLSPASHKHDGLDYYVWRAVGSKIDGPGGWLIFEHWREGAAKLGFVKFRDVHSGTST